LSLPHWFACGIWYAAIERRLAYNRRQARLERLQRAEQLWKERNAHEFDNVAPHAAHHKNYTSQDQLLTEFAELRQVLDLKPGVRPQIRDLLETWLDLEDLDVRHNVQQEHPRWIRPYLLPPHPDSPNFRIGTAADDQEQQQLPKQRRTIAKLRRGGQKPDDPEFFKVARSTVEDPAYAMTWLDEYDELERKGLLNRGPPVDYTQPSKYVFPPLLTQPPADHSAYPPLQPLGALLKSWPQDEDYSATIHESLQHFNYSNPTELEMAKRFRDAKLPFKLYDIPEVDAAAKKWTDDYVGQMFGDRHHDKHHNRVVVDGERVPLAEGTAQESPGASSRQE